jgi:hypothetical protein
MVERLIPFLDHVAGDPETEEDDPREEDDDPYMIETDLGWCEKVGQIKRVGLSRSSRAKCGPNFSTQRPTVS